MLRTTLEFLAEELNAYLKRKDPTNFGNDDVAIISPLMSPDGTFAVSAEGAEVSKIILTLVNLEEERINDVQNIYKRAEGQVQIINPPVNLNIYVVFSAFGSNYGTTLRLLSYVISFFQANAVFTNSHYPQMNAKVADDKPWQKIGRLVVNLHATTFEQQNNMWSAIGAKYMPNVVYKIRTMSFIDFEPKMEAPPITEVTIRNS